MKILAFAAALALGATSATAGNLKPMMMDAPEEVGMIEDPAPTGTSPLVWLIPLMAVAAIALTSDSD